MCSSGIKPPSAGTQIGFKAAKPYLGSTEAFTDTHTYLCTCVRARHARHRPVYRAF